MSDDELIEAFEGLTLAPGAFHHADHVHLAFAYLRRHELFEGLERYRMGLKRFTAHVGASDKYHETVTCALVILIHERMIEGSESDDWGAFAAANPDLLDWKNGTFFTYYDRDVMHSDTARTTFVLPGPSRVVSGARSEARG